jgi:hypothetical protein
MILKIPRHGDVIFWRGSAISSLAELNGQPTGIEITYSSRAAAAAGWIPVRFVIFGYRLSPTCCRHIA